MKHLILLLFAAIVVASCQNDPVEDPTAGLDQRVVGTWKIDVINQDGLYAYFDSLGNTPSPGYAGDLDSTLRDLRAEWVLSGEYDTIITFTDQVGSNICNKNHWLITGSPWLGSMYHYTEGDNIYTGCDVWWIIEQYNSNSMILYSPPSGRRFYLSK